MVNDVLTTAGEIVDGRYRLGGPAAYQVETGLFETEFGFDARPAVIRIRESKSADVEGLTTRWREALSLDHPNLLRIYASGPSMLNEVPIVYLVMERPDESLENVLRERALSTDETNSILSPVLAALKYLHKKGFRHSRLGPSTVLAVGDHLKLSCDHAKRLEYGESTTADLRDLGVLIVQALTQRSPDEILADVSPAKDIPAPLAEIVKHCLDPDPRRRWTAEQMEVYLENPEAPLVAQESTLVTEPSRVREVQVEEPYEEENASFLRKVPAWLYSAVAGLLVIVLLIAVTRKEAGEPTATATSKTVEQTVAPPASPRPAARGVAPQVEPPVLKSAGRKADGWSVIVGSYNSREGAERRRNLLAKRWPNFHVTLADSQSGKSRYVITLGQNLSEVEAAALRKRAVQAGMTRDTYIKRVK